MCGGPSKEEKSAITSQTKLADEMARIAREREALQLPFVKSRIEGGLPFRDQLTDYQGGTLARSFAPVRAETERRLNTTSGMPSGFKESVLGRLDSQKARSFDDMLVQALMLDEETRARAAGLSQPLGYFSGAQSGFDSILSRPQQPSPWGAILGGALGAI